MKLRTITTLLLAVALCAAARADQITVRMPTECVNLINALASLDGVDKAVKDSATGEEKALKVPYDFGKDGVRLRLAIRKNLLALKGAFEAYEIARVGYVKEIFGVENLSPEAFAATSQAKKDEFAKRAGVLAEPVRIEIAPFTEADFTTFAGAGIPGTVSVALEAFVAKPAVPAKK